MRLGIQRADQLDAQRPDQRERVAKLEVQRQLRHVVAEQQRVLMAQQQLEDRMRVLEELEAEVARQAKQRLQERLQLPGEWLGDAAELRQERVGRNEHLGHDVGRGGQLPRVEVAKAERAEVDENRVAHRRQRRVGGQVVDVRGSLDEVHERRAQERRKVQQRHLAVVVAVERVAHRAYVRKHRQPGRQHVEDRLIRPKRVGYGIENGADELVHRRADVDLDVVDLDDRPVAEGLDRRRQGVHTGVSPVGQQVECQRREPVFGVARPGRDVHVQIHRPRDGGRADELLVVAADTCKLGERELVVPAADVLEVDREIGGHRGRHGRATDAVFGVGDQEVERPVERRARLDLRIEVHGHSVVVGAAVEPAGQADADGEVEVPRELHVDVGGEDEAQASHRGGEVERLDAVDEVPVEVERELDVVGAECVGDLIGADQRGVRAVDQEVCPARAKGGEQRLLDQLHLQRRGQHLRSALGRRNRRGAAEPAVQFGHHAWTNLLQELRDQRQLVTDHRQRYAENVGVQRRLKVLKKLIHARRHHAQAVKQIHHRELGMDVRGRHRHRPDHAAQHVPKVRDVDDQVVRRGRATKRRGRIREEYRQRRAGHAGHHRRGQARVQLAHQIAIVHGVYGQRRAERRSRARGGHAVGVHGGRAVGDVQAQRPHRRDECQIRPRRSGRQVHVRAVSHERGRVHRVGQVDAKVQRDRRPGRHGQVRRAGDIRQVRNPHQLRWDPAGDQGRQGRDVQVHRPAVDHRGGRRHVQQDVLPGDRHVHQPAAGRQAQHLPDLGGDGLERFLRVGLEAGDESIHAGDVVGQGADALVDHRQVARQDRRPRQVGQVIPRPDQGVDDVAERDVLEVLDRREVRVRQGRRRKALEVRQVDRDRRIDRQPAKHVADHADVMEVKILRAGHDWAGGDGGRIGDGCACQFRKGQPAAGRADRVRKLCRDLPAAGSVSGADVYRQETVPRRAVE